jgi:hypothetical protein
MWEFGTQIQGPMKLRCLSASSSSAAKHVTRSPRKSTTAGRLSDINIIALQAGRWVLDLGLLPVSIYISIHYHN